MSNRFTFTYNETSDGDIVGRLDRLRSLQESYWHKRSRSEVAKELLLRALREAESELGFKPDQN